MTVEIWHLIKVDQICVCLLPKLLVKGYSKSKEIQTLLLSCGRIFVFHVYKRFLMMIICLSMHISLFNSVSASPLGFVRHLLEANETLKAEVTRLKEVAVEKQRDIERLKVNKCGVEKRRCTRRTDKKDAITNTFVFHLYNRSQARIQDQGNRQNETKCVIYLCGRCERACECVCVRVCVRGNTCECIHLCASSS